jgi:glycosyltransferase involved in cell wall biosynthesis
MRIAVWHDLPSGGGMRAMVGQIRELVGLGHDVAVWSPNSSSSDLSQDWWPAGIVQHERPFEGSWQPNFFNQRFGDYLNEWRRRTLHEHARAVVTEMRQWKADVLLVHPCWWFHASPLALYWDGASVLYLQEPFRPLYEASPENVWAAPPETHEPAPQRLRRFLRDQRQLLINRRQVREEVAWVRAFGRVLVNSLYSRESVARAYGIDAAYCPLGVDHPMFASLPTMPKEPFVVSLGQLSPHKDPRFAIAAVAEVPEVRRPQLRWFGNRGDAAYLETLQRGAKSRGVDFVFEAALPDDELARQLARAACFVFCARLEPLGLAPLEANLAGTPVVAIAEGGVRETIIDGVNGTLVFDRDATVMGSAIDKYVSDLSWAGAQGVRAREHVMSQHTWTVAGRRLEAELRRVISPEAAA